MLLLRFAYQPHLEALGTLSQQRALNVNARIYQHSNGLAGECILSTVILAPSLKAGRVTAIRITYTLNNASNLAH